MHTSLRSSRIRRALRLATTALALLVSSTSACSSDDSVPLVPATRLCEPGLTRQCVGDGACAGGQVCAADGASWGACRCGAPGGAGGGTSGGGSAGNKSNPGGKGGASGGSQAGGKGGSTQGGQGGTAAGSSPVAGSAGESGAGGTEGAGASSGSMGESGAGGGDSGSGGDSGAGGGSESGAGGSGSGSGGASGQGGTAGQAGAGSGGKGGGLVCAAWRGDCDGDVGTGCETDLKTSGAHCGACGASCGGKACLGGQCDCDATRVAPVPQPADLFLMLDKSSSMDVAVTGGSATKWALSVNGLNAFIDGVQVADRAGMGLGLFPNGSCNPSTFAVPKVAIADLPPNAGPLKSALAATAPNGADTPTKPALEGAIMAAKKRLAEQPGRAVAVVLLTDGEPNECTEGGFPTFPPPDVTGQIASVAKAGAEAGVPTYVVGVFASSGSQTAKNAVQKWASAGGTGNAFVLASSPSLATDVTTAFASIRSTAGACVYEVPASLLAAPTKATVVRESASGTTPLARVSDAAACKNGDWYYDDEAAPTKLLLCPARCADLRGSPTAKVLVAPGCTP